MSNSRCVFVTTKTPCFTPDGRKENKKMKRDYIKFRCSIYEKKLLKLKAKKAGISLSEYCRSSAFENNIIERLTKEQLQHYAMLVKYKNNFKSISNMFKKRNPKLVKEVEQLAEEIRTHLYNFKK